MHIGKEIHNIVKERGLTTIWIARQLNCNRSAVYRMYEHPTIDTGLLMQLCKILDEDFFKLYSSLLE